MWITSFQTPYRTCSYDFWSRFDAILKLGAKFENSDFLDPSLVNYKEGSKNSDFFEFLLPILTFQKILTRSRVSTSGTALESSRSIFSIPLNHLSKSLT